MSDTTGTQTETKIETSNSKSQNSESKKPARATFLMRRLAAAAIVISLIGGAVWYFVLRDSGEDPNIIKVSGRIEGDDAAVAAKVAGRIREITVREGDQVKAGQVIAVIDDDQVRAREQQERSKVRQAEALVLSAQQRVNVLEAELEENKVGVDQARLDAQGRVSQAEAEFSAAEAQRAQARANHRQAIYDEGRYTTLANDGDVPARTGVQARSAAEVQAAALEAADRQVDAARAALMIAKANLSNVAMRSSRADAAARQISQAQADLVAAQAETEHAQARLKEVEADRNDLQVIAPIDGTVATRSAEPGEVVVPGTPLVTLVNLNSVYLRGFIPEGEIGRVRTGQSARVFLDSAPEKGIEAVVTRIDPEASFTPENTYFRDDRVKQVVGVKLQLKGGEGYAKPGMPADGEVIVGSSTTVAELR